MEFSIPLPVLPVIFSVPSCTTSPAQIKVAKDQRQPVITGGRNNTIDAFQT